MEKDIVERRHQRRLAGFFGCNSRFRIQSARERWGWSREGELRAQELSQLREGLFASPPPPDLLRS